MKKALFLFALLFYFTSYSQNPTVPPPGCRVYTVFDSHNDGFASFDLDAYFIQLRNEALTTGTGYDLSGYTFKFYPSRTDYDQGTNQVTSSQYTNVVSHEQHCYIKFVYSGTGPVYDPMILAYNFTCHVLKTTNALTTMNLTKDLIQLYPNPVSGILNVKWNKEIAFTTSVYDLNGRLLIAENTTASIDVSKLKNGIYLVKVTAEGKAFTQKIMVAN